MLALLRIRGFRNLVIADAFSAVGDSMMLIILGVLLRDTTGSNSAAGVVALCMLAPNLAGPALGAVADRFSRRAVLMTVSVVMIPVVLLVPMLGPEWTMAAAYATAIGYGTAFVLIGSAQAGLVPNLVPATLLGRGNAMIRTLTEGARFVAPALGGLMYAAHGAGVVAAVDALTFGVAAVVLLGVPRDRPNPQPARGTAVLAGIRHILLLPGLRRTVGAAVFAFCGIGFLETAVFAVVTDGLGKPASFVAVFAVAQGVCAILAGFVVGRVLDRLTPRRTVAAGLALFAVSAVGLTAQHVPVAVAAAGLGSIGMTWFFVAFGTAVQEQTPNELQGRTFGSARAMITAAQVLSIGAGALLGLVVDYRVLLAGVAASCLTGCVIAWRDRAARDQLSLLSTPDSMLRHVRR